MKRSASLLYLCLPLSFLYSAHSLRIKTNTIEEAGELVTEKEKSKGKGEDKKFKPHATLIALHAADCKWQCRGYHLLLAASFNLMSSKMEFHFIFRQRSH